ncbi:lipocalin-like domain-containing protein [Xanthovirga aplysinae]|uniref:lipocalin-like domain-containing protein n=1 Tax=Xanthovirga aplysinae TaxID=2529853 RepID=UPI0012BCBAA2|nr:lipocalin-like domain-containing protein [Xanthovirga aplysinae]MTI30719.1 hypothetical protein [Xanthovirga aplysinae]
MNELSKKFIGTWRLVYSVEIDKEGNKHYPFGKDAIGSIWYDASYQMCVQICRKQRTPFSSHSFREAKANELFSLPQDYLAYFGKYKVDETKSIVHHLLQGHLCPNYMGETVDRKVIFFEDKMLLKPIEIGEIKREILWQKSK